MRNGSALLVAFVLAPAFIWFGMMRQLTIPEQFVMQLACSNLSRLSDGDKFNCWTMLHLGRVFDLHEAPAETCNDPRQHPVGNHRCCSAGYHSNDNGASPVCYKD